MDDISKSKIEILFKEYDTLRTEIDTRIKSAFSLWSVAIAALAIVGGLSGTKTRAWVIASVAIIALVILWYLNESATRRCAKRVSQIEKRINDLADEELLEWELKWGAVTTGYFPEWREVKARIVDCWRQAVSRLRRRQS